MADWLVEVTKGDMWLMGISILWVSAILSAIIDNIPFVATMRCEEDPEVELDLAARIAAQRGDPACRPAARQPLPQTAAGDAPHR